MNRPPLRGALARLFRPRQLSVQWERVGDHAESSTAAATGATGGFSDVVAHRLDGGLRVSGRAGHRPPNLFSLLFAIPFWASWVFVASIVAHSFCQRAVGPRPLGLVDFRRDVVICIHSRQAPAG